MDPYNHDDKLKLNLIPQNNNQFPNQNNNNQYPNLNNNNQSNNFQQNQNIQSGTPYSNAYQTVPINTNFQPQTMQINTNFTIHPQFQPSIFNSNSVNHVVRALPAIDRKWYNKFSYVKCPNITTSWVDSYGFSYLTAFNNDQNYYFAPLTDTGVSMSAWNESLTKNKVTREKMTEFIFQVNSQFNLAETVKKAKSVSKKRLICSSIFSIITLIVFIVSIYLWILGVFQHNYVGIIILTLIWSFSFVCCLMSGVYAIFNCSSEGFKNYEIDKNIINSTQNMENFLNIWNNQYFLPNGLYVMAPRNLKYIQFVLDSNINFSVENHSYPLDLVRHR